MNLVDESDTLDEIAVVENSNPTGLAVILRDGEY